MSATGQQKYRHERADHHEKSLFHIQPLAKDISSGFGFQVGGHPMSPLPRKILPENPHRCQQRSPPLKTEAKRARQEDLRKREQFLDNLFRLKPF
jgi:hypothetical protein